MSASIARLINTLPIPVFGSARTAALFTVAKAKTLPRMVGWAGPLAAGALWFVWPAVDDEWKMEMGLMADPEAAMKAAEAAKEDAPKKVELSPEAEKKIEEAYKASDDGYVETDEDKVANAMFAKAAETGDYTYLEEKWEVFVEKATRPGEDDDDDDEDDEDEDEDDEDEDEDE